MKKSISISNLTLGLWLEYVRPAARAAGILEEVPARDDWHEYTAEIIDEAAADEIAHCMYCACMNSHIANSDYTRDGEARQMLHQLEVSMKYDIHHTDDVITLLYNALSTALTPETIEEEQEENTMTTTDVVVNEFGHAYRMQEIAPYMDYDIRERLHCELAPCPEQVFFDAYCAAHERAFGEPWLFATVNPQW